MNENAEDLYLKGFMAYSAKDYGAAKAQWEKVLQLNPNHAKARKGLAELGMTQSKKMTSKDVLREIKKLYGEKQFGEALKLCRKLLQKHPGNQDLLSLYRKIESRCQKEPNPARTSPDASVKENSVAAAENDDQAAQIEMLIQSGVSLYEVQDYANAIKSWEKALALDPENPIAKEYIQNVQSLIQENESEPEQPGPVETSASAKPDKDKLVLIYNEAMEFYKKRRYRDALEKWRFILKFYPNHKETRHCVDRASAALEKEKKYQNLLDEAKSQLASGHHMEAERILTKVQIEAPHLEGVAQLSQTLEERQQQISEIRSLDIEEDDFSLDSSAATDDEITRYFTPETDGSDTGARQVSRVVIPQKEQKGTNKLLLIGVPILLLVLGAGAFFGYSYYQKQERAISDDALYAPLIQKANWKSEQQKAEDFLTLANDFRDEGLYLLATYAYLRVEEIAKPRLAALREQSGKLNDFEIQDEINRLSETLAQARAEHQIAKSKIVPLEHSTQAEDLAEAEFERDRWEEGGNRLYAMLTNDYENARVREKLGDALTKLSFQKLADNELDEALQLFKKVTVLKTGFEMARRHMEVIQRFYDGKISGEERDQWFFFFE